MWVIIMVMDFQEVMSFFKKKIFLRVCVQLMKKQQQQTKNNDIIKIRTSCERFLRRRKPSAPKEKKSLTRYESQRAGECG